MLGVMYTDYDIVRIVHMSIDFIVTWQVGRKKDVNGLSLRPTKKQLHIAIEDYFRGIATSVKDDRKQKRNYIILPGKPCNPTTRLLPSEFKYLSECMHKERWIEIYYGSISRNIDVITRSPDEITLSIARGFAKFCARYWQGKCDFE